MKPTEKLGRYLDETAPRTHEGALAARISDEAMLRRSVLAHLLWEDTFYEDGEDASQRVVELCAKVDPEKVAALAVEARSTHNLRHIPLLLVRELARRGGLKPETVAEVIQRADETYQLLALFWEKGHCHIPHAVREGINEALLKFDEYQLAKYDRKGPVTLRDVLRVCHPKTNDAERNALYHRVVKGELKTPDTWEVALSAGADKKETWERLMKEGNLGYLALLRNLRNMEKVGVDHKVVADAILARKGGAHRVLPFRFIAAAKAAPGYEGEIDQAMVAEFSQRPKLPGKTLLVVDVSGSMYGMALSEKSDMDRAHAACALAAIARELCEEAAIYATAGDDGTRKHRTEMVPSRRGMALVDAIYSLCHPLGGGGIFLNQVCGYLAEKEHNVDRMIVITDEQDCAIDSKDKPALAEPLGSKANYLINVHQYKNGIGYGPKWTHIDGFSEAVFSWILEYEALGASAPSTQRTESSEALGSQTDKFSPLD